LFSFTVEEGFCRENPVAKIDFIKTTQAAPGVVRADDIAAVLRCAREHFADILPALVIQAWAGLRTAEVERLQWEDVRIEDRFIEVNAAAAKNNARRPVHIEDNLALWLVALRQPSGAIVRKDYNRRIGKLRRMLAVQTPSVALPHNGLRHSFGTYHCAHHDSTHATADQMGNSPAVVKAHYRAVASKADAARWFAVTPASLDAAPAVVPFSTAAIGAVATPEKEASAPMPPTKRKKAR
jgi:integrase